MNSFGYIRKIRACKTELEAKEVLDSLVRKHLIAQKEPVAEVPCCAGLCANSELIRDLKAHLGVDGERKGVEYCTIYDEEWADIIRMVQDAQY